MPYARTAVATLQSPAEPQTKRHENTQNRLLLNEAHVKGIDKILKHKEGYRKTYAITFEEYKRILINKNVRNKKVDKGKKREQKLKL